jgi:hypothetical protein
MLNFFDDSAGTQPVFYLSHIEKALRKSGMQILSILLILSRFPDSCFQAFLFSEALFTDENEDAGGQRHNVQQENGRTELQAEP